MQYETASCSCRGGREYQEDCIRVCVEDDACAVVVADGLGGHGNGQIASATVADAVTNAFFKAPVMDAAHIQGSFELANAAVIALQTSALKMKSTGVALFVKNGIAIWGHVGDSRLYHFKAGALAARTLDHSVSQMAVFAGEISPEQIRHHADRNRVLRAFGVDEGFRAEITDPRSLEPCFHAFLLCTDGFWEYVLETEMEIELSKAVSPVSWIQGMVQRLGGRVPEDHDNFSAAAVFVSIKDESEKC